MGQLLKLTQAVTELTAGLASDDHSRPARSADVFYTPRPAPVLSTTRSIRSRSASGGCWRENDVMEMTKRGVPGVWTYGFYDGWVPNYMIFIAHSHNADRPLLRSPELRTRQRAKCGRRPRPQQGVVPSRIRRCRSSSGARATTPTSSNRPCCSRSTTSRKNRSSLSRELLAEEQASRSTREGAVRSTRGSSPRASGARRMRRRP